MSCLMNRYSVLFARHCSSRDNGILNTARYGNLTPKHIRAKAFQLCARGASSALVNPSDLEGDNSKSLKRRRGLRKTTIALDDLPQGMISTADSTEEPVQELAPTTSYPTVIQQALDNMHKFPNCVVLTRVGNFYELYFDQAHYWGKQLNIKVASRRIGSKRTGASNVPMAGFPFFQLERYLKVLVQEHAMHVAIAEEKLNDPSQKVKSGGLMFDRQVRRIITPGTLIDENFLSPNEHNWLLGIWAPSGVKQMHSDNGDHTSIDRTAFLEDDGVHLSWIDLSSGDFFVQRTNIDQVSSTISRIAPGEIIVDASLQGSLHDRLLTTISESGIEVTFFEPQNKSGVPYTLIPSTEGPQISASKNELTLEESACIEMLLNYVQEQLPGLKIPLQAPVRYESNKHLSLDKNTLRGLEILQTMKDGGSTGGPGSLLHAVKRTNTQSGARLLSQRLKAPSLSLEIIEGRLNLVQSLLLLTDLRTQLTTLLRRTNDSLRLVQSLACGKGNAQDLISLARTISLTHNISGLLDKKSHEHLSLGDLSSRFQSDGPEQLASRILDAIDEDALMAQYRNQENEAAEAAGLVRAVITAEDPAEVAALQKRLNSAKFVKSPAAENSDREGDDTPPDDNWIMQKKASITLETLHKNLEDVRRQEYDLEKELQDSLNAKSLSLKWTPSLGHIVHVKGKDTRVDPALTIDGARTVGSTKSTRSFWLPAWTTLGARLEEVKVRIRAEEQQLFRSLREDVCTNITTLRANAKLLDELDVACSSAALADECKLVRPILDDSTSMQILNGRHMTVEAGLKPQGRSFTPNDCLLGISQAEKATESIHLITGPNMAGKSTYLRQTALLAILAQTGLYVPASYARLGLVDAVFSRIGSADNLYQDQSTFMVEMLETAEILRHAGKHSLVVMDEVGRGTSPEDGVAVGYAVLERLRRKGVGRVMFATHFHRILDLCREWKEVGFYCTRLIEEGSADGMRGRAGRTSFRFDHKMRMGANRDSHALKVARLAGVDAETVGIAGDVLMMLKGE